jgi:hypothetical protein
MTVGHVERAVLHALIASDGAPVPTSAIIRRAYPRLTKFEIWRYQNDYCPRRMWKGSLPPESAKTGRLSITGSSIDAVLHAKLVLAKGMQADDIRLDCSRLRVNERHSRAIFSLK